MLIGLSFFDTWYLFGSILESFRIAFDLETNLHIQLFPYFLYPGQMIVMMCSVYMTVAIAIERFSAVRYPLIYNQVCNDILPYGWKKVLENITSGYLNHEWYLPGQMIVMMCSVYMTVAIAIERFSAVRYPLIYNQVCIDILP